MLQRILEGAGLTVRIGSLIPDLRSPLEVEAATARSSRSSPIAQGQPRGLEGFDPCAVLLNNDLSAASRDPARHRAARGAAARRGLGHAPQVAPLPRLRPRRRGVREARGHRPVGDQPGFSQCGKVNFAEKEGEDCLAANVDYVLGEVREKYAKYGITETPFAIVKADAGTYGMGIMT
jgi:glutamate--cysteine ligase